MVGIRHGCFPSGHSEPFTSRATSASRPARSCPSCGRLYECLRQRGVLARVRRGALPRRRARRCFRRCPTRTHVLTVGLAAAATDDRSSRRSGTTRHRSGLEPTLHARAPFIVSRTAGSATSPYGPAPPGRRRRRRSGPLRLRGRSRQPPRQRAHPEHRADRGRRRRDQHTATRTSRRRARWRRNRADSTHAVVTAAAMFDAWPFGIALDAYSIIGCTTTGFPRRRSLFRTLVTSEVPPMATTTYAAARPCFLTTSTLGHEGRRDRAGHGAEGVGDPHQRAFEPR